MQRDFTKGDILQNIVLFSLPYLLSYFLQTLYGLADLFIIGQFNGAASITAVSMGSQMMHMLTVIIVGLAMGTTVVIGQSIGAGKEEEKNRAIGNSVFIFLVFSILLMVGLLLFTDSIISIMKTPVESLTETKAYLLVCFWGVPFIVAYNVISSVFRGMGDSKSPMYIVAAAGVINIILDYLLVGLFSMHSLGAALATVFAQALSVILALVVIVRRKMIQIGWTDLIPSRSMIRSILGIGVPVALQDGFIQVSFLVITAIANHRGVEIAAAVGIVEKIICILFLIPSTMLSTVSAVGAQNIGAGQRDRAKKTLGWGIIIVIAVGIVVSLVTEFIAPSMVGLFTKDAVVAKFGAQYLRTYVVDCIFAGIHFCFSGYFCACSVSILSFLHNCFSILLFRIPGALIASRFWPDHLGPMGLAAPAGSLFSVVFCAIAFVLLEWKVKNDPAKVEISLDYIPDGSGYFEDEE